MSDFSSGVLPADQLPSFQQIRRKALWLLGDAQDTLRSDWRPGAGPTGDQAEHLSEARRHIAAAKTALDRAAAS